ncbi:MAG: helix-turn-helix domain-containing protein [Gemmatimonadaceae bacterium]
MDTRATILNAAVRVFSQHGFRGSTTRRIADAASVNEVTIFRYFGSKEALLQEAIRGSDATAFKNPLPADPQNPLQELTQWSTAVITHLHARSSVIRKCMGEMEERPELSGNATEAPIRATNELCTYFRKLRSKGFTEQEFDPAVASAMLIGSLFHDAMGRDMMPDAYPKPANKAPGKYAHFILRALGVRDTAKPTTES